MTVTVGNGEARGHQEAQGGGGVWLCACELLLSLSDADSIDTFGMFSDFLAQGCRSDARENATRGRS